MHCQHWRDCRSVLPSGSQISMIGLQVLRRYYINSTLNTLKIASGSVDWLFCTKFWTNMWWFRWIIWIWFCVIDLSEDPLPNRDSRYLAVPQLSFSASKCMNYYWVEFITRLSITPLASVPSCYIMPVGVHTSLLQYPPGVWQLSSRSRHRSRLWLKVSCIRNLHWIELCSIRCMFLVHVSSACVAPIMTLTLN